MSGSVVKILSAHCHVAAPTHKIRDSHIAIMFLCAGGKKIKRRKHTRSGESHDASDHQPDIRLGERLRIYPLQ